MACDEEATPGEPDRVEAWRFSQLVQAGYPTRAAATLAAEPDVDLHAAVELVTVRGCDPLVAIDILL